MSKIKDSKVLKHLKSTEFVRRIDSEASRLIIPKKDYIDLKTNYCGICGKRKVDPVKWFGEDFCKSCVKDLDPTDHYDKNLKGKKGFSRG